MRGRDDGDAVGGLLPVLAFVVGASIICAQTARVMVRDWGAVYFGAVGVAAGAPSPAAGSATGGVSREATVPVNVGSWIQPGRGFLPFDSPARRNGDELRGQLAELGFELDLGWFRNTLEPGVAHRGVPLRPVGGGTHVRCVVVTPPADSGGKVAVVCPSG